MATLIYCTGFEHGVAVPVTSGGGLFNTVIGTPSIQGTTKRTGDYALEISSSAAAEYVAKSISGVPATIVGRLYFRFNALPDTDALELFRITSNPVNPCFKWMTATSKIRAYLGSTDYQESSGTFTTGVWYRLDFKTVSGASPTLDWQIDGAAQTQVSTATSTLAFTSLILGWLVATTGTMYVDDVAISATSGDYPIGAGGVIGLRPNADGVHDNIDNDMVNEDGQIIDGSTYYAYSKLYENPWITTANDDLIEQLTPSAAYCEINFANTAETIIHGVMGILQYASASATANTGATIVMDSNDQVTSIYGTTVAPAD